MKATDLLVQCLENEGVEYIFGIMGKETLDLMDSLSKSYKIQFIHVRHEQGAAFMADVYARLSNKAGVCLATLGPGATNLLTGMASANLDHSPVVAITGQKGFEGQHEESHQYVDVVKNAPENAIVISDVGAHKVAIARTFQPKQAGRLIISNGLASMGIAIPGSIGAKLACQNDPVICITGDGGALMNISELETAKRLGLSLIIIILNDRKLKLEEQMMEEKFNNSFGTSFENPDFLKLAESFQIKGVRPKQLNEFEEVLKNALQQTNEIVLIDIQID